MYPKIRIMWVVSLRRIIKFMVESMSVETKKEFEKWHADQVKNNVEFDFQKELYEYCCSDVQLLKEGCMVFQTL